jgi:hypothetical protein
MNVITKRGGLAERKKERKKKRKKGRLGRLGRLGLCVSQTKNPMQRWVQQLVLYNWAS